MIIHDKTRSVIEVFCSSSQQIQEYFLQTVSDKIRDFLLESLDMVDHPSSSGDVDRALNEVEWKAVKKFWKYPSGILLLQLDSSRCDFCGSAATVLQGTARITLFIATHLLVIRKAKLVTQVVRRVTRHCVSVQN